MLMLEPPMHPNIGLGLGAGGAFLLGQIALALLFRSSLSPLQLVGVAAILGGMVCLCLGGPKSENAVPPLNDVVRTALVDHTSESVGRAPPDNAPVGRAPPDGAPVGRASPDDAPN
jgi:hypothetical protein